jgi:hypothetical protein
MHQIRSNAMKKYSVHDIYLVIVNNKMCVLIVINCLDQFSGGTIGNVFSNHRIRFH